MAKKKGAISKEEKHDEITKASLCLLEKKAAIQKYSRKKKIHTLSKPKTIIKTTDPEKWKGYV